MDDLPAGLDPRTFPIKHIIWYLFLAILQDKLSVIIVPLKPGTDFLHYRKEIEALYNE